MGNNENELRCVVSATIAKKLCNLGYHIVDIKEKRNSNGRETVFLFKKSEKFEEDFTKLVNEIKKS